MLPCDHAMLPCDAGTPCCHSMLLRRQSPSPHHHPSHAAPTSRRIPQHDVRAAVTYRHNRYIPLQEVRAAVGPDVEVILDGGVRRGLDIVKGLARGADACAGMSRIRRPSGLRPLQPSGLRPRPTHIILCASRYHPNPRSRASP